MQKKLKPTDNAVCATFEDNMASYTDPIIQFFCSQVCYDKWSNSNAVTCIYSEEDMLGNINTDEIKNK